MKINEQENHLFGEWRSILNVSENEFVSDGLLFHDGLKYDGYNWVRTSSGNNSENWQLSPRRLLIITRDQPCDDGDIWDVRRDTPIKKDGCHLKKDKMYKCLIPWTYAALLFDNEVNGICPNDEISRIGFWLTAPLARINCGKLAGKRDKDGGCPREKVVSYLDESKGFITRQIMLYNANIIICCTGYDKLTNPLVEFIKNNYLLDLEKVNNYVWASKSTNKIVIDAYHFTNWKFRSDDEIPKEALNIRDAILDALEKGYKIG